MTNGRIVYTYGVKKTYNMGVEQKKRYNKSIKAIKMIFYGLYFDG